MIESFLLNTLIFSIILLPLIGASFISLFIKNTSIKEIQFFSLFFSFFTFIISLFLWVFFDNSIFNFQFIEILSWLPNSNINCFIGIDGISLFFILLVTLLCPICILSSFEVINKNFKEYIILFLIMESFLIIIFFVFNLHTFSILAKLFSLLYEILPKVYAMDHTEGESKKKSSSSGKSIYMKKTELLENIRLNYDF